MNQSSAFMHMAVLGGDVRQNYLANYLSQMGHSVTCFLNPELPALLPGIRTAASLAEALAENTVIIGPVPFSRDQKTIACCTSASVSLSELYALLTPAHTLIGGSLPPSTLAACIEKEIPYYDFMKSEALAYYNAEITAEGMLCEVLKNTPFTIQNKSILILGYGKCGTILAHKLDALGCQVSVCELSAERRELASSFGLQAFSPFHLQSFLPSFSVIINTVPSLILSRDTFTNLSPDVFLFDLASPPGGIDFEAAKEQNIPVFHCLGLPGKIAPLSAGEAIAKNILERISAND